MDYLDNKDMLRTKLVTNSNSTYLTKTQSSGGRFEQEDGIVVYIMLERLRENV
jgi:hypothetical protein